MSAVDQVGPTGTEGADGVATPAPSSPGVADARSEDIVRRLKSVEGHVRGVERMVEEGAYCIDVVNQILAVQRALEKVSARVLERHLHTCVTTAIRSEDPDERARVIEEVMGVFRAGGKV